MGVLVVRTGHVGVLRASARGARDCSPSGNLILYLTSSSWLGRVS